MAGREEKPCGRELTEDGGSIHRRDPPHWQENGNQWRPFIPMLLCLMLILLPFPFLSVLSPSFPGTSQFTLTLLSSWLFFSFPVAMSQISNVPHGGKAYLPLQAEDGSSFPTWAASFLPQTCLNSSQGTPCPGTEVSCSGRRAPPGAATQALGWDGLPEGSAHSQPPHSQFHWSVGQQPLRSTSFLRSADVRAKLWVSVAGMKADGDAAMVPEPSAHSQLLEIHVLLCCVSMHIPSGTVWKELHRGSPAHIKQKWALRRRSVMVSKGMLCASVCLPVAAYKKERLNQMRVSNRSKSS